ncbi:acyltransferase family protein [Nesterenkonia ebinurensis]|uniref:acyltransferase family protein n=1 Tax=Nesterenkonia ebinurensis TaxID=2608252 RepID=UPI00123E41A8|nr:acyltransferase [Nesterenkonia ebinurensis]
MEAKGQKRVGGGRIVWLDVARGLAILLLVSNHATQQLELYGWDIGVLRQLNQLMVPIRQPLFFIVAGLLLSSYLTGQSRASHLSRRLLPLAWIFLVWSTIWWLAFMVLPQTADRQANPIPDPLSAFINPTSPLWFVYAVMLYIIYMIATWRLPGYVVLGMAAVVSLLFRYQVVRVGDSFHWVSIGSHLVFFVAGMVLAERLSRLQSNSSWPKVAVVTMGMVVGVVGTSLLGRSIFPVEGLPRYVLSFVGAALGLLVAGVVARKGFIAALIARAGKESLPIYVMHTLIMASMLAVLSVGVSVGGATDGSRLQSAAEELGPIAAIITWIALFLVSVLGSITLGRLFRTHLPVVFRPPQLMRR